MKEGQMHVRMKRTQRGASPLPCLWGLLGQSSPGASVTCAHFHYVSQETPVWFKPDQVGLSVACDKVVPNDVSFLLRTFNVPPLSIKMGLNFLAFEIVHK